MEVVDKMIGFYKKAVLENYFNFKGRSGVGEYWWFVLANVIVSILVSVVDSVLGTMIFGQIYSLALLLPGLGAGVRRLHDMGKNGWWILAPIYNIWLLIQKTEQKKNAWGEPAGK